MYLHPTFSSFRQKDIEVDTSDQMEFFHFIFLVLRTISNSIASFPPLFLRHYSLPGGLARCISHRRSSLIFSASLSDHFSVSASHASLPARIFSSLSSVALFCEQNGRQDKYGKRRAGRSTRRHCFRNNAIISKSWHQPCAQKSIPIGGEVWSAFKFVGSHKSQPKYITLSYNQFLWNF